jgi:1-acyl-sn-glycerol-3-phosphate acyltransferase
VRKTEPWYRLAELTVRPPLATWFNWRFEGLEHIPSEGPVLVACNHLSYFDPLAHGYMLVKAGRRPRYLAKKELFGNLVMRSLLRGTKQIPVDRGSGSAAPVEAAQEALRRGEVVLVYPEATITDHPDFSPMRGKTGIARLTLGAEVPVLPMAVWGSQYVWRRPSRRRFTFGRPIWVKAGPPLDFSAYADRQDEPVALRKVTDAVMDELIRLVDDLRSRYPKRWVS